MTVYVSYNGSNSMSLVCSMVEEGRMVLVRAVFRVERIDSPTESILDVRSWLSE